jgi:hypothetical protein
MTIKTLINTFKISLIALLFILNSCGISLNKSNRNSNIIIQKENWETFALGDINNDGINDTAFVYTPKYYESIDTINPNTALFEKCENNNCYNKIKFSTNFNGINIKNSLWGKVETIEDLDNDGIKEIIFQTNWWIGTHVKIIVYSYNQKTKKWTILCSNSLYEQDSYKDRVTKIDNRSFKFKIEYMDTIESDLKNKEVIIEIRK